MINVCLSFLIELLLWNNEINNFIADLKITREENDKDISELGLAKIIGQSSVE